MSAPHAPLTGDALLVAVTDAMVGLHERYHHRVPVTAKTLLLGGDLLACVLGGVYTDVEKTMIELQRTTIVQETRSAFQNAMQHKFIAAVEDLSGRDVLAFISNHHVGPDMEIELFMLKPEAGAGAPRLEQLGEQARRPRGAVALDVGAASAVGESSGDRGGDGLGRRRGQVHRVARAVALQAMAHVQVLLEVPAQGEVDERRPGGGELHARRQAALRDRDVAGGEVAREAIDVGDELEAIVRGERVGVDARPAHDDHAQPRHARARLGWASMTRRSSSVPTPEPPTVTTHTTSSGP